jgi:ornithine carbamoyltransferase
VPVINALTDRLHPCQAMADALTILEHGDLRRDELCYVGDGNNMCHSLLNLAGCLGMRLVVSTPPGYAPDAAIAKRASELATRNGGQIRFVADPHEAVKSPLHPHGRVGQHGTEAKERAPLPPTG